jgi:biopolymer transport protein ExbD
MAEINMIPLVDVMLVLLIIFMITAPLIAHKIKIDLPQASTVLLEEKPDTIVIALMADGRMFLNDVAIDRKGMVERLAAEAQRKPQPELHLHVDRTLQFSRWPPSWPTRRTQAWSRSASPRIRSRARKAADPPRGVTDGAHRDARVFGGGTRLLPLADASRQGPERTALPARDHRRSRG